MSKFGLACIALILLWNIGASRILTGRTRMLDPLANIQHHQTQKEKYGLFGHENHHEMTSLLRKRRNAVAMSQELIINKQVQVFQGLSNPDTFRVSITGNTVFPNTTVYDLIISEDTTGLEIRSINNPSDPNLLNIQTNLMTYDLGTFAGTDTLEFSYDATLRDFGSEIAFIQNISTLLQYQLSPLGGLGNPETLNVIVCIQKSIYAISTCSWCGAILIIVVCFVVGILFAFLLSLAYLCLSTPQSIITSTRRSKTQEKLSSKKEFSTRLNLETIHLAAVLNSTENEKQMLNYVETLEIRQLVELKRTINEERISLTKEMMQAFMLLEKKHNDPEDKETIQYCLKQLATLEVKEKAESNAYDLKGIRSNVKGENSLEHQKEIEKWNEKLKDFEPQVKEELMSLVEQRHVDELIDDELIENLNDLMENSTIISAGDLILENCLEQLEKSASSEFADVLHKILDCERLALKQICNIFSENVRTISEVAQNRKEVIRRTNEDLRIEKKIWEKITAQQLDVVRKAKRLEMISPDEAKEVNEKVKAWMKILKVKHEEEVRKVKCEISKTYQTAKQQLHHTQRLHDHHVIEDADDAQKLIINQTAVFAKQLKIKLETETKFDKVAFKLYESLPSILSRFRKLAIKEKKNLKEALLGYGTDPLWVDKMFESQREELRGYCDDIDDAETTSSDILPHNVVNDNNANFRLLQTISASQAMASQSANLRQMKSEILLRKKGLHRFLIEKIQQASHDYLQKMKKKKKMIDDVIKGDDVIGIRRELQEKLSYAVGNKKKSKQRHLRSLRHHSLGSYRDLKVIISDQLCHHYQRKNEKSALIRERHAMEELTMAMLELMTSSGQLSARECKLLLDQFRLETEEIKSKYLIERKRKEEALKRKTERKLVKKGNALTTQHFGDGESSDSLTVLLHVTDAIKESSSAKIDDERSTVQELFSTVHDVSTDQERALLSHELILLQKLTGAMRITFEETESVLDLLLPGKSVYDVKEICNVIYPEERVKKKGVKPGILLEAVQRKMQKQPDDFSSYNNQRSTSSRHSARSQKLSPLGGASHHGIGIRPEPLGRSSSLEKMDRYNLENVS